MENIDELINHSRELRAKLLSDPLRPTYHFVAPEGIAMPFDSNGCIYWKGKYHLLYIFQDLNLPNGGHCRGHVSSIDLLHWTHHPTALAPLPGDPDQGIFSGNAFVNKQGEATILYHGCGVGNCIATSSEDGTLRIEPIEELARLRLNHRKYENIEISADKEIVIDDIRGDSLELIVEMELQNAREFGVTVRRSPDGLEQTVISCDPESKLLKINFGKSSLDTNIKYWTFCMGGGDNPQVQSQEAPFEPRRGETLKLHIFLDRSILEVFANGRQCITQQIYPTRNDSLGVSLFSRGGSTNVKSLNAWDMVPANPC